MAQVIDGDLGYRVVLYDASGNPILTGPLQLDDTDKLAVSVYGKGTAAGDTAIAAESVTQPNLRVAVYDSTNRLRITAPNVDGLSSSAYTAAIVIGLSHSFNGTTFDRSRNNHEVTALASAARTADVNSADLTSYNARGVVVVIDVTAITDTPSIVVTIAGKDTLSGKYASILASPAIVGVGTTALIVYPGNSASPNAKADQPLPRIWRVQVVHADADSITYSVGANYIV